MPRQDVEGEIAFIGTVNITVFQQDRTDGKKLITLVVPDGLPCRSEVTQTDRGRSLLILGKDPDLHGDLHVGKGGVQTRDVHGDLSVGGGFIFQARKVSGGVHGRGADKVVIILVPPGLVIPQSNVAPGVISQINPE